MSTFLRGSLLLMLAIFLSKFLGFIYRMQFVRLTGEEAYGIYMTAYPAFIFFLSLIQLGIPIAMSKIIAELRTRNAVSSYFSVMRTSVFVTVISILAFTPIFLYVTPFISENLLKNDAITMTLYVSIAIVPIAAAGGILKGFFQGIARIEETAVSQLMEQIIRILLISFLLPLLLTSASPKEAAAYAMGMSLLGEVAALLYLRWKYVKWKAKQTIKKASNAYPLSPLFSIALPSSGSKLFGSFTWFLEPIIFIKALAITGITSVAATTLYGVISGVLVPLLLFPSFIPYALSVVLIPAVSDAFARRNNSLLKERIHLSLKFSTLTGCYAATLFYLHGGELVSVLFHVENATVYMKILSPIFFFYYIQSPLFSILQALNNSKAAFLNSLYGGVGKLLLLFFLASQAAIQEKGAVVAIGFGVLITSFLHIASIREKKEAQIGFSFFALPYVIFLLTIVSRPLLFTIGERSLLIDCFVTLLYLTIGLVLFRQIKRKEVSVILQILRTSKKKF
ncbi:MULTISPECIES: oligosaccharide flippase family protein [Bacillaceae]|uniref:putative polysaccharide biosynthesis protein n=1 Tax=Bacillaceae TaxID=186817 RepID=UPI0006F9A48B|nr:MULTISPECIES: oligosaccharide flippase family protein [Bacillaceae]KQL34139.1 stage V sporulation protein B [Psychrobacillus sp. FJAT-21963]MDF2066225.1 oligosaccharide flippase family protein [Bacillus sp. Cr_A10]